ncbi:MAG: hypothetical protein JO289_25725, partial [Xanthobacteraceae bacterium]|nr:hypothetical protein [Xanthobacteraceae bacterium]
MSTVANEVPVTSRAKIGASQGFARPSITIVVASAAWLAVAALVRFWPDTPDSDWAHTGNLAIILAGFGGALAVAGLLGSAFVPIMQRVRRIAPWLIVLAVFI